MPTIEDLKREKRRYGLAEDISDNEILLLKKGMPVQKIMGFVDMQNVRLDLSFDVLIPRYETEELVQRLIKEIPQNARVLDLCTGSGFIAIALKFNRPDLEVVASDISDQAIFQTQRNALYNGVNIKIIKSDLFKNLEEYKTYKNNFDVIVTNPPYLGYDEKVDPSVINYEPIKALFCDEDGWEVTFRILEKFSSYLKENGKIYFEINPLHINNWEYLSAVYDMQIIKDMEQKDRFVIIKKTLKW